MFLSIALALVFGCKDQKPAKSKDRLVVNFKKEGVLNECTICRFQGTSKNNSR